VPGQICKQLWGVWLDEGRHQLEDRRLISGQDSIDQIPGRVHTGLRQNETDLAGGCQSPVAHLTNVSAQDVDVTKTLVQSILGNDYVVFAKDFTNGLSPDAVAQSLILVMV
jgi:hypothetical protein